MKQENLSLTQTALKPKRKSWETAKEKKKRKEAKNFFDLNKVPIKDLKSK